MMYEQAVSDVIIIRAGSAGLSCAYHLGKTQLELKITIIEANIADHLLLCALIFISFLLTLASGGGVWLGGQLMVPHKQRLLCSKARQLNINSRSSASLQTSSLHCRH